MKNEIIIRGARKICEVVGKNRREIVKLVQREGLPAWREHGQGPWFARREDLEVWAARRAQKFLGKNQWLLEHFSENCN